MKREGVDAEWYDIWSAADTVATWEDWIELGHSEEDDA